MIVRGLNSVIVRGLNFFVLVGVLPFHVFCKECTCFFIITCTFDICHHLMILCHFDQMNDRMMLFLFIKSILLSL